MSPPERSLVDSLDELSSALRAVARKLDLEHPLATSGLPAATQKARLVRGALARVTSEQRDASDPAVRAMLRTAVRSTGRMVSRLAEHRGDSSASAEIIDVLCAVAFEVEAEGTIIRIEALRTAIGR